MLIHRQFAAPGVQFLGYLIILACTTTARAQTAPDAGSLLRQSEQKAPQLPTLPTLEAPRLLSDTGVKISVKRFEVEGSTRFSPERFAALLADLVGKELGFAQMQAAADRVAALYRTQGLHATAILPEQTLEDGVVRIRVIEGHLGAVKVEPGAGNKRPVPLSLLTPMLSAGQTAGQMIDTRQLERATLIANDVPGVRVSSVLTAGANPGQSDIIATVDSRPPVTGVVSGDNEDPRSTGAGKMSLNLALADMAGIGDQAQLIANTSEGKHYADLAYSVPLGSSGLRGALDASYMRYRLLEEFAASGGRGQAATAGVNLTYPLLRSETHDLYLSGGYNHRHLINDADAGNLSDKKTDSFNVGINGDSNDALGGGGAMVGALSFTGGKLNLDGDAADLEADAEGPHRDGSYAKVTGNLGRLQRLTQAGSLWVSVNGQYAGEKLDSSEQFSLGGPSGVRAYPVLEASGDQGVIATAEYRYHVSDALQLSAYYDFGHIDRERDPQPSAPAPNSYSLQGVGVGVEWNIAKRVALHGMTATRIGTNPAANANGTDSDGTKRRPQFWVLAEVPF